MLCRPPSLILPSGPIPMCPAYTSVKSPKSGTLAKEWRLNSGRKRHTAGHGMGGYQLRTRLEMASDIHRASIDCAAPLGRPGAKQDPMKSRRSVGEVPTELPNHIKSNHKIGARAMHPCNFLYNYSVRSSARRRFFNDVTLLKRSPNWKRILTVGSTC